MKKRSLTMMVVPSGQPASESSKILPASRERLVPLMAPVVLVSRSMRLTDAMAASASPRKPIVPIAARSSAVRSLEVAWRLKAVRASSGAMPQPLSVTRKKVMPPSRISTVTWEAPASTAFSSSSFTTLAGRSTTSPAAIRLATWGDNSIILGIRSPQNQNSYEIYRHMDQNRGKDRIGFAVAPAEDQSRGQILHEA